MEQRTSQAPQDAAGQGSLAARLRRRRRQLGLTLKEVASGAGLSVGFISQIERGITVPSLTSLIAVCRTLKVEAGSFLNPPKVATPFTRREHRPVYGLGGESGKAVSYERLSASFPGNVLKSTIIHEPPGHRSEPMSHEGEEIFFILQGALTLEVDGECMVLEAGDSAHFPSVRTHTMWNHTGEPTTILHTCTMDVFGDGDPSGNPADSLAVTRAENRWNAAGKTEGSQEN